MNPHRPTAGNGVHRTTKLLLAIATAITLTVVIACSAEEPPPTDRPDKDQQKLVQTIEAVTGQTNSAYMRPEWAAFFTKNPKVLAYRWYKGDECPSGNYSHRDDLYIFDSEEVLSEIEQQERGTEKPLIGTEGFHSPDGYICLALSQEIHPSSYTALHELAHAIVYVEQGLTGHNKMLDQSLTAVAIQFKNSGCRTQDSRLLEHIALATFFPQHAWDNQPTETPQERALFNFCYPEKSTTLTTPGSANAGRHLPTLTAEQIAAFPTRKPEFTTTQILLPTLSPQQIAEMLNIPELSNNFVEIHYDASTTINNRQAPLTGPLCQRGPLTAWSRTLELKDQGTLLLDANELPVQVLQIDFAKVHTTKKCQVEFRATVTIQSLIPNHEPNLTGFIAEFRTEAGHLIARTHADERIAVALDQFNHPEDLYDKPARLLIYDQFSQDTRPTPTPEAVIPSEQKHLTFTINPQEWESYYIGPQNHGLSHWTEVRRTSPDLSSSNLQITDAKGAPWTISSIYSVEEIRRYPGPPDRTKFTIYMSNNTRATADFTGYAISLTTSDPAMKGGGNWDPTDDKLPLGQARIKLVTHSVPTDLIEIRMWDTFEPSLAD